MAWVITSLCRDCLDLSCTAVCPVDCIYKYTGSDTETFPNQLYIHPEECIDCGVCEPECPWEAIHEDSAVPDLFHADIALNASMMDHADEFVVPREAAKKDRPTEEQVAANKAKWGFVD